MNETWTSLLTEWDVPPVVVSALALVTIVYLKGWFRIRRTRPSLFPAWRLASFLGGISALFFAVASPLDTFSESLLFMHMAQHYVLMSVAPPLIVLGMPVVPLLRGLPYWCVERILAPIFRIRTLRNLLHWFVNPCVAFFAMNLTYVGWHVPAAYEFALSSEGWHNLEHFCFFGTSVLFWWPVIQPWPFHGRSLRWGLIPYLLLSDILNTALSAFLCFSGRLLYPSYGEITRPLGLNALNDQVAAGAFMWVFGSLVFLIPAVAITARLLSSSAEDPRGIRILSNSQA